jgi:hypothetical protein
LRVAQVRNRFVNTRTGFYLPRLGRGAAYDERPGPRIIAVSKKISFTIRWNLLSNLIQNKKTRP